MVCRMPLRNQPWVDRSPGRLLVATSGHLHSLLRLLLRASCLELPHLPMPPLDQEPMRACLLLNQFPANLLRKLHAIREDPAILPVKRWQLQELSGIRNPSPVQRTIAKQIRGDRLAQCLKRLQPQSPTARLLPRLPARLGPQKRSSGNRLRLLTGRT